MLVTQAEVMAKQMNNLSDKQLDMLLKGASWLQSGVNYAQRAKAWVIANKLLAVGLALLFLALLLRYLNIL
jgi:hypothetical protein